VHYRVIYIYSVNPRLNKTVLRRHLKDVVVDRWSLMSVGRLFHARWAATANARSPNLLRDCTKNNFIATFSQTRIDRTVLSSGSTYYIQYATYALEVCDHDKALYKSTFIPLPLPIVGRLPALHEFVLGLHSDISLYFESRATR